MSEGLSKARLAQFTGFSEAVFRRGLLPLSRRYPAWAVWLSQQTGHALPFTMRPPREGWHPYPLRVGLKPYPRWSGFPRPTLAGLSFPPMADTSGWWPLLPSHPRTGST